MAHGSLTFRIHSWQELKDRKVSGTIIDTLLTLGRASEGFWGPGWVNPLTATVLQGACRSISCDP